LLALAIAPAASAARGQALAPGIGYERRLEFTRHGPVVIHVLTAPKPGGLYSLDPVLSNGVVPGRETVSQMQRRLSPTTTAAGINGDFADAAGSPNGTFLEDGVYKSRPNEGRSSIGIDNAGNLVVQRFGLLSTWQGSNQRRALVGINRTPGPNGVTIYTPSWGAVTPPATGTIESIVIPFPPLTAGGELRGQVVQVNASGGGTPIPPNGAVLVGRGGQGSRLAQEAGPGVNVNVRLVPHPPWTAQVENAIGGGPQLVRDGRPLFRAGEEFSTDVLSPREARAAVGQRRDGSIVMVAVDGDLGGYSVGMTSFELAQALVRLGCRTGAALEGGPATAMAFDGTLLSRPSAGAERPVSEGLFVLYHGVQAPDPQPLVLSPNKDGIDERQLFRYKLPRPAAVAVRLIGPDGGIRHSENSTKARGSYQVSWPGTRPDGSLEPEGNWRWVVTALDEQGQSSTVERRFTLNTTLGFLRGSRAGASFRLARPAHVKVTLETRRGAVVRTLLSRQLRAGPGSARWTGRRLPRGRYVVRVVATNQLGRAELSANVR
jgi:flagellar hook assembly protein FlgD